MSRSIHDIRSKISEREIARWKAEFQQIQAPVALAELVQRFEDIVGDHAVDSPRADFWRDAYLALTFSRLRKASSVQMLEPKRDESGKIAPDFQIKVDGIWARYELVEALPLGRHRSDEFREDREVGGKARVDHVPSKEELTAILSRVAIIKASKASNYADCRGLVIMLSTWALLSNEERKDAFTAGTEEAGKAFDEVWVIKQPVAHLVWSGGSPIYPRL